MRRFEVDLELVDGRVTVKGVPNKGITLAQIGKKGNGYMSKVQPVLGTSRPAFTQQAPAFAAQLARIGVDADTGELTLHDFVVVQDAGRAIRTLRRPRRGRATHCSGAGRHRQCHPGRHRRPAHRAAAHPRAHRPGVAGCQSAETGMTCAS